MLNQHTELNEKAASRYLVFSEIYHNKKWKGQQKMLLSSLGRIGTQEEKNAQATLEWLGWMV